MQHYVYDAWNVQTFGLCFPRFLKQVVILVLFILSNDFLTILRQIFLTPQEVGDWFGCEGKKKRILFLEKKKDFFCFKNSVVSVLRNSVF